MHVHLMSSDEAKPQAYALELAWLGPERLRGCAGVPHLVFLHEGLGSVAMWRDFPARLILALNELQPERPCVGLLYSRLGYGASSPTPAGQPWPPRFMHQQAQQVLPALLAAVGIEPGLSPLVLVGHSDGGSIALLYASAFSHDRAKAPAAVVALAPHLFVEGLSLRSIARAKAEYERPSDPAAPGFQTGQTTGLRAKLGKYHQNVDCAFYGWSGAWLSPAFASWNIEDEVAQISQTACPILAIQGEDDEYGTMAQIERIAHWVPSTRLLKLGACGHSPHRDQPQVVKQAIISFVAGLSLGVST